MGVCRFSWQGRRNLVRDGFQVSGPVKSSHSGTGAHLQLEPQLHLLDLRHQNTIRERLATRMHRHRHQTQLLVGAARQAAAAMLLPGLCGCGCMLYGGAAMRARCGVASSIHASAFVFFYLCCASPDLQLHQQNVKTLRLFSCSSGSAASREADAACIRLVVRLRWCCALRCCAGCWALCIVALQGMGPALSAEHALTRLHYSQTRGGCAASSEPDPDLE